MLAGEARQLVRQWLTDTWAPQTGFIGAFLSGSFTTLSPRATLPWSFDVDVTVVCDNPSPTLPTGKVPAVGVLIDCTVLTPAELSPASRVASTNYLAPSFRGGSVLLDPTGALGDLENAVSPRFTDTTWVTRRIDDVCRRLITRLSLLDQQPPETPWHELVIAWMFPTSLLTQVPIVATFGTPTVRKRYVHAGQILAAAGLDAQYEELLDQLGCRTVTAAVVNSHLAELGEVFDAAAKVASPHLPYASDITPAARTIAIDGSQELIDSGHHREAVF